MIERRRLTASGVVQGIGFRPFIYRLATELALCGHVRNDGVGVTIEVEGDPQSHRHFDARLRSELPAGGRLDRVGVEAIPSLLTEVGFQILASDSAAPPLMTLAPDRVVCEVCVREMTTPSDRRYRYPFINCTHCGPRYTITKRLPYDRPMTTMARFPMCPKCRREYGDPLDRRYHAQPIACPVCGPVAWLHLPGDALADEPVSGEPVDSTAAIVEAAAHLRDGRMVAVKGLGGFHLAVDAASRSAVIRLRELKRRKRKPFAMMVRDLDVAASLVDMAPSTARLLTSPAAPIVLAPARESAQLLSWVAPGLRDLGVMLPYTPMHRLLMDEGPPVLVMTSGNPASEPITIDNKEAVSLLGADAYLLHNRDIAVANDDSVIRTAPSGPVFLRRSRGYVPEAIDVQSFGGGSALALGALLKVAPAVLHQGQLVMGRHLGDLDNERAEAAFEEEVDRMLAFARFEPEIVAVDLHPDIPSGRFAAERFPSIPVVRVQHHHAHLAAVMVEHGIPSAERVVGILLDGFGYGSDGTLWGGEILEGGYTDFERLCHLRPIPQPGGDMGALEPVRMATSLLLDADLIDHPVFDSRVAEVCRIRAVSPLTSSAGRLFDGVSALLDIGPKRQDYEGEAAALVEAAADTAVTDGYPLPSDGKTLDTRALIEALISDRSATATRAARFINGIADGFASAAASSPCERVVLGGGCMVNRPLVRRFIDRLEKHGKTVLLPKRLPAGDGGLSAGQAMIAAHRLKEGM